MFLTLSVGSCLEIGCFVFRVSCFAARCGPFVLRCRLVTASRRCRRKHPFRTSRMTASRRCRGGPLPKTSAMPSYRHLHVRKTACRHAGIRFKTCRYPERCEKEEPGCRPSVSRRLNELAQHQDLDASHIRFDKNEFRNWYRQPHRFLSFINCPAHCGSW